MGLQLDERGWMDYVVACDSQKNFSGACQDLFLRTRISPMILPWDPPATMLEICPAECTVNLVLVKVAEWTREGDAKYSTDGLICWLTD